MKIITALILSALTAWPCVAAEPDSRLQFKSNGFSIAPLEERSETAICQAVMMFLPATEGFAPSVNVQIQPFDGTINDFASLSQQQFKAAGFTVVSENITKTTLVWEYSGLFQGRKLHWYARAVQDKKAIYLVTATAADAQWKTVSVKLKACVDSFKIEDGEQPTERVK
jgi:hypothetical protein